MPVKAPRPDELEPVEQCSLDELSPAPGTRAARR